MPVLVLWSPGVDREIARRLIECEGLPSLGLVGDGAQVINHCRFCGSTTHGQPQIVSSPGVVAPHLSISYADDLTMVALTEFGPVGVDVERFDAASFPGFDAVAIHAEESMHDARARTVTWTRKESLLKATGHGLTVDPRRILLTEPDEQPQLVKWNASDPPQASVWMQDVVVTSAHVAAVTVLSEERPALLVKRIDLADPAGRTQPAKL